MIFEFKTLEEQVPFVKKDQEIMATARFYNQYLLSLMLPFLKGDILEIGSGIGNITGLLLKKGGAKVRSLLCIEPESDCVILLRKKLREFSPDLDNGVIQGSFPEDCPEKKFDAIFHLNVLEHIEDDQAALEKSFELLNPGGFLCMFVPAFPVLFGSMDQRLRHFRRYTKEDLETKMIQAGFSILVQRYCNFFGFFGWFFNNRVFKINRQSRLQVLLFDSFILPIQVLIEKFIEPPIALGLFVVGQKK